MGALTSDPSDGTEPNIGILRHAPECPVAGTEVQDRRPVVGEVLHVGTTGAAGGSDQIVTRTHRGIERVATHDLVQMRRGQKARVDQRVEALKDELRAAEPYHGLGGGPLGGQERPCQTLPLHLDLPLLRPGDGVQLLQRARL